MIATVLLAAAAAATPPKRKAPRPRPLPPVTRPTFEAQGREPGWSLMVDDRAGRATLRWDYGKQVATIPLDQLDWSRTPGGCEDSMTGVRFSDTVKVSYGGRTLSGCGEDVRYDGESMPTLERPRPAAGGAVATDWTIVELDGLKALVRPAKVTISGDRISGNAGCNRISGFYRRTGDRVRIGPLMSTRMACPPDLMAQEVIVIRMLEGIDRFEDRGDGTAVWSTRDGRRIVVRR